MELGPKRPSPLWFWGPNSITVVYMDPVGNQDSNGKCVKYQTGDARGALLILMLMTVAEMTRHSTTSEWIIHVAFVALEDTACSSLIANQHLPLSVFSFLLKFSPKPQTLALNLRPG